MRRALALLVLVACSRTSSTAPAPAPSMSAATAAPAPSAPAPRPSGLAFLRVAPLPSGPVAVKGYPQNVANGMNEYADHVGFSADSRLHAYCWQPGGPNGYSCEILARDGTTRSMFVNRDPAEDTPTAKEKAERQAIDRFLADEKIPALSVSKPLNAQGPVLSGTWRYTDITLDVLRVEATTPDKTKPPTAPAHVKVGGSVTGEPPVYPVSLVSNPVKEAPPHFAALNGFTLSPDGAEFGLLGTYFACEYCVSFVHRRMPVGALASAIYNDTGYRHHQKKEWAAAAALFEKAVAADPSAKLAAYNLACAWARTGDPRAKDALDHAIAIDSTAKARAQRDEDFAAVRSEAWFPK